MLSSAAAAGRPDRHGARVNPHEFAAKIDEWARGTMIEAHGTRFVTAGQGRAEPDSTTSPS